MNRGCHRVLAFVALAVLACDAAPVEDGACGGEVCDLPASREEVLAELDGLGDPVAEYFRGVADEAGAIGADYEEVVAGVGAALGCDPAQRKTFVVLSNLGFAPKAVVTHCADDPVAASQVLTIFEPGDGDDLDAEAFRMAAWDDGAGVFRRYQMAPHPEGGLGVVAEPEFCLGCHGGTEAVLGWSPIMNEMTNPWAQWNAEPAFESFMFEDPRARDVDGPTIDALTQQLDSASNLEPIVRSGIDRYIASWIADREAVTDLETAAAMLRPVFCDETFNYVSEVHDSGELRTSAVIDAAIRKQLIALDPAGWPWAWVWDDTLRITPPEEGEAPMALIAVRGELAVQAEAALVTRQVLTSMDVLRVRALDWTHPVASELRCTVFEEGVDSADPATASIAGLYEEIMRPYALPAGADVVAVAEPEAPAEALTLQQWGDAIEVFVNAAEGPQGRESIEAERIRRGCIARRRFPIAPLIPGTDACR